MDVTMLAPWAQYGIAGIMFGILVWVLISQRRELNRGLDPAGKKHGLVPGGMVQRMLDDKDANHARELKLVELRGTEWKAASEANEERAIAAEAREDALIEQLRVWPESVAPLMVRTGEG